MFPLTLLVLSCVHPATSFGQRAKCHSESFIQTRSYKGNSSFSLLAEAAEDQAMLKQPDGWRQAAGEPTIHQTETIEQREGSFFQLKDLYKHRYFELSLAMNWNGNELLLFWFVTALLCSVGVLLQNEYVSIPSLSAVQALFMGAKGIKRLKVGGPVPATAWKISKMSGVGLKLPCAAFIRRGSALGEQLEDPLQQACTAVLVCLLQRRNYGSGDLIVHLTRDNEDQVVEISLDLDLSKTSFSALAMQLHQAWQQVQKEATTTKPSSTSDGDKGFVLHWISGESTAKPQERHWCMQVAGAQGAEELHVVGPSFQDEACFKVLFEACCKDVEVDISKLPILDDPMEQHVKSLGAPMRDLSKYRIPESGAFRALPEMLSEVALQTPSAPCVVGDSFATSFQALVDQANSVADAVASKFSEASKPEVGQFRVVLFLGRGEAIVPGCIALLKIGACAIPIDIKWPKTRVEQVVSSSKATLVLVDPSTVQHWKSLGLALPVQSLLLDSALLHRPPTSYHGVVESADITQDTTAAILFTSGTTGKPKGILLSHGYMTALAGTISEDRRSPDTRHVCYFSPAWLTFFDACFSLLLAGGCCLMLPDSKESVVSPGELSQFCIDHKATSCSFVPVVLDLFLDTGLPPTLSDVGVGGALVTADLCRRALAALPCQVGSRPPKVRTGYSGTEIGEVTVAHMEHPCDVQQLSLANGAMTAGPVTGCQGVIILDPGLQPVALGDLGEICVFGPMLADGYLDMPEKTKETFLTACPAADGQRLVRSADLGRWTEGGLQVAGRRDSMVKVRGARIELEEVQGVVASHLAVSNAIVTVVDDRLIAYVVPSVPADLREFCKSRLVSYMVPHVFEPLSEVPLLSNGKVNKAALPQPSQGDVSSEMVTDMDSLGRIRQFRRRNVAEDVILDNVRAFLLAMVILFHNLGLHKNDRRFDLYPSEHWGPFEYNLLNLAKHAGWSSLAFLSGFDDTRSIDPYGLQFREFLFPVLWLLTGFNWTVWYLPVFAYLRIAFCAAHRAGLEKLFVLLVCQSFVTVPIFFDLYTGWNGAEGACATGCICPFKQWESLSDWAVLFTGWWVTKKDQVANSFFSAALTFIPVYFVGFYAGPLVFPHLASIANEERPLRRACIGTALLAAWVGLYTLSNPIQSLMDDRCEAFQDQHGGFNWSQVFSNMLVIGMKMLMSLLCVLVFAACIPFHAKQLAKVSFLGLLASPYLRYLLSFQTMVVYLRHALQTVPTGISTVAELLLVFVVPFLFMYAVGTMLMLILQGGALGGLALFRRIGPSPPTPKA